MPAKKYILSMHQLKAKHIKFAGLTRDEVLEFVKKNKEKDLMDNMDTTTLLGKKIYKSEVVHGKKNLQKILSTSLGTRISFHFQST